MKAPRPLRARTVKRKEVRRNMKGLYKRDNGELIPLEKRMVELHNENFTPGSFDHKAERRSSKWKGSREQ